MAKVGVIKELLGIVQAVGMNGDIRVLVVGDVVNEGETLITVGTNSGVKIAFANGRELVINADENILIDQTVISSETQIQQALLEGEALPEEATAAGEDENDSEGGITKAYVAQRTNERGDVETHNLTTKHDLVSNPEGSQNRQINQAPELSDDIGVAVEEGIGTEEQYNASVVATGNALSNDYDDGLPNPLSDLDVISVNGITQVNESGNFVLIGEFGTLLLNAKTGEYSYTIDNQNPKVDILNINDSLLESFAYTVSDGGKTDTANLSIVINGANDAPIAVNDISSNDEIVQITQVPKFGEIIYTSNNISGNSALEEGLAGSQGNYDAPVEAVGNVLINDVDVDNIDYSNNSVNYELSVVSIDSNSTDNEANQQNNSFTIEGKYGLLVINVDGNYIYTADNINEDVNTLNKGEKLIDTFTYTLSDNEEFGAKIDTATLIITIEGSNDAPTVEGVLVSDTDEDQAPYTISLLTDASDVDNGALLHVENLKEVDGKGGWDLIGDTIRINPNYYNELNDEENETLNLNYQIIDEHGKSVEQTLRVNIEGITDAPSIEVTTLVGDSPNEVRLHIISEPADTERVDLSFLSLASGASLWDESGNNVTGGISDFIDNYGGDYIFTMVLPENVDVNDSFIARVTGVRENDGYIYGSNEQSISIVYDADSSMELVSFYSNNQNMWGNFDGYIGWHEYIPLMGEAPITWNEETQVWDTKTSSDYWRSGQFSIIDVSIQSEEIYEVALQGLQWTLNLALDAQAAVENRLEYAQGELEHHEEALSHVNDVSDAWANYVFYEGIYTTAHFAYEANKVIFDPIQSHYNYLVGKYENAPNAIAEGLAWIELKAYKLVYDPAKVIHDGLRLANDNAYTNSTLAYNEALNLENAMHDAGFYTNRSWADGDPVNALTDGIWEAAQITYFQGEVVAEQLLLDGTVITPGLDDVVWLAQEAYNAAYDIVSVIEFDSELQVNVDLFAQIGIQIDFELDLGSVDTDLDYQLTSMTQYNQTTDMLSISPMMTNVTTGDDVAFSTISPNATFYTALLYDVGADLEFFIDGNLVVAGQTIFDMSPNVEGININTTLGTNTWTDMLATIPEEYHPQILKDMSVGELVLIDFDSTEGGPWEIPFLDQLTQGIFNIELDFPTIETEGTAETFNTDYYDEGGFVSLDITEITDTFLNLINAKLDFSEELKELYNVPDLGDSTSIADAIASMATGIMDQIWDILDDGQSEGVPIFVIDATDETSSSLLHFNLFDFNTPQLFDPTYSYTDGITEYTGSMGFYVAYGESDPVIKAEVDIDAAVALIVNEVVKAVAIAASAGSATAIKAIPTINPLDIEFGIEQVLKMAEVDETTAKSITDYVNLGVNFEMADIDVNASANFSQEFTLSLDDMAFQLVLEDGSIHEFKANEAGELILPDASSYDSDGNGTIDYSLSIIPEAMFSNDTEVGLSVGYNLDFLKANFEAGVKLPLAELLGIQDASDAWPDIEFNGIDIGVGPLLQVKGDMDLIDIDVFESRFNIDVGSVEGISLPGIGIDDNTIFDGVII